MNERHKELQNKVMSGFFGFWVKKYRISYLLTLLLIAIGSMAAYQIPKESAPNVDLGMVNITTVYPGANPTDIDSLVTDKIYKEIENLEGVSKIDSTSSLGVSSVVVSAKTDADIDKLVNDIRNRIASVSLPTDAREPTVTAIETKADTIFSIYLYKKNNDASRAELVERAENLKKRLEWLSHIKSVTLSSASQGIIGGGGDDFGNYDAEILISEEKMRGFWLSLAQISTAINAFNRDQPIGNFAIGEKNYDYRIAGKYQKIQDYLDTPIALPSGGNIRLGDIASVERKYSQDAIATTLASDGKLKDAIGLTIKKKDSSTIFQGSDQAKQELVSTFQEQGFAEYGYSFSSDIAGNIIEDYKDLAKEAATTLVLVFIAMLLFVGFTEALFATMTLPLAFLATFIILNEWGYTMNFLTNFSLILSFGIAIDTIIVFVQASSIRMRIGYNPKTAIFLALREYAPPTIVGVLTTIVVFVPMMALPGVMGRFLSYIPVTIFGVLATGLVLALTLNIALYILVIKKRNTYVDNPDFTEFLTDDEKELLAFERIGKKQTSEKETSLRTRTLDASVRWYKKVLKKFLENTFYRRMLIVVPIVLFFLGSAILAPKLGFELMPADDNNRVSFTIEWPIGLTTTQMAEKVGNIDPIFENLEEIRYASVSTNNNTTTVNLTLTPYTERRSTGKKNAFEIEKIIAERLAYLKSSGLTVEGDVAGMGDMGSSAIGINLIAQNNSQLPELIRVSKDFENYLKNIDGTKNVGTTSKDTPGQFIVSLDKWLLAAKWVQANTIYSAIAQETNGMKVGSIEDNGRDIDVKIKNDTFQKNISPDQIENIAFTSGKDTFRIWDFVQIRPENAIQQISRKNGDITISVESDLENPSESLAVTNQILTYAKTYDFPAGISYSSGGENSENSELVMAMVMALIISVVTIFGILTYQFNSFAKPAIVFYSVFMAVPFVLLGLLITGNPLSMTFGIGFIAFMGIAVNHGIILIDAINLNTDKGMNSFTALVEAGASRLEPMVLTTITTVAGMIPIALKNKMWAGLGWTIVFGLIATTIITLFTLKWVYYELFFRKNMTPKKPNLWQRIRKKFASRKQKAVKRSSEIREETRSQIAAITNIQFL